MAENWGSMIQFSTMGFWIMATALSWSVRGMRKIWRMEFSTSRASWEGLWFREVRNVSLVAALPSKDHTS